MSRDKQMSMLSNPETDQAVDDSVFLVGRVTAVQGRSIQVSVDKSKNNSHLLFKGDVLRNVSVGGYLKITKGFSELIVKVDGEQVEEDRSSNSSYRSSADKVARTLSVSLIGFFRKTGRFERGVRELPLIDNECFLLTHEEFNRVHNFVDDEDTPIDIGALAMERGQRVEVGIDAMFASHIGIFGNTGSGKSYTLAKLYYELFQRMKGQPQFLAHARFVLIDFNGEYIDKEPDGDQNPSTHIIVDDTLKTEYKLSTRKADGEDKLPLSQAAVTDPTFWTVLLDATEKTQAPFLQRTLESDYWDRKLTTPDDLSTIIGDLVYAATKSTDSSFDKHVIINFLGEIAVCLGAGAPQELYDLTDEFNTSLSFHSMSKAFYWGIRPTWTWSNDEAQDAQWRQLTSERIADLPLDFSELKDIDLVRFKIVIQYYSDIIRGFANKEHLGPLIKRLETRIPDIKKLIRIEENALLAKSLTVVSLKDVKLSMRKVLPMILCKQLYENKKNTDVESGEYLNLIIDEAHNILSSDSARESEAWRDYRLETFEEIIKEGRKFGVFLTLASQRPHDISETIISQLHNYFLHRLINNLDIHAVERAVSYLDRVSFESLPILPTGTCVLSGISAQVPVVVDIDRMPIENEPNNKTMSPTNRWFAPVDEVVEDLVAPADEVFDETIAPF